MVGTGLSVLIAAKWQSGHKGPAVQKLAQEREVPLNREAAGFALAPFPVMIPFTVLFAVILLDRPSDSVSVIEAWLELAVASYGASLLVGIPVHLALRRLGRHSLTSYLVGTTFAVGVIIAAVAFIELLLSASFKQNPFRFTLVSRAGLAAMLLFEGLAIAGAWIFWRVSVRPRDEATFGSGHETSV